jgi:hypothetical protein
MTALRSLMVLALLAPTAAGGGRQPVYKDLRKPGSKSSYAVAFVARAGVPGHAFVIFGFDDPAKQACVVEGFGFYPVSAAKAAFGSVPGKIVDEYRDKTGVWKAGTYLVVLVERELFDRAEAVRKKWAAGKDYRLLAADCVTFQSEVAKVLGLKTPNRTDAQLPTHFAEKLRELNR